MLLLPFGDGGKPTSASSPHVPKLENNHTSSEALFYFALLKRESEHFGFFRN
jgi:hypothetical protein